MWDLSNEKHCPKCGGKMMDLILTSYPAQCTSKCMSCGYTEDLKKETLFHSAACDKCQNNRRNGGSGICNCTLGQIKFTS